uniref:Disease resistance N-terminal domain-containing protein n=1 Tax=Aegilops tauschii subsp. strangulata TaxID=200361 RepID=A0A452ZNQ6_AEGTS
MDVLLSAVVSDLFGRSASFVINRYFQRQPGIDMILQRLERVVLRIDTVVEEAEGRHITNQGMLRQLKMLRQGMYRGHYVLDALTFQAPDDEEEEEEEVSHSSSALTNVTPAKRLRFSQAGSSTSNREELLFEGSLKDEGVIDLKGENINGLVKHRDCASSNMLLIIVEIGEDINKEAWRRLKSSTTRMTPRGGSKIIITSRSGRIVNLGTTETLWLDYLPPEAYWHFFKSIAFGSTNPNEHPKLATMAMEIALEQRQCFTGTHLVAGILRDNFNARFWRTILECVRAYKQTHLLMFEKHPNLRLREDEPVYYWRLAKSRRYFLICNYHQSDSSSEEVPKISVRDILLGCTLPHGEFEALAWRSRIPPYYNYTISCKMQAPEPKVGRKKRMPQDEGHLS